MGFLVVTYRTCRLGWVVCGKAARWSLGYNALLLRSPLVWASGGFRETEDQRDLRATV